MAQKTGKICTPLKQESRPSAVTVKHTKIIDPKVEKQIYLEKQRQLREGLPHLYGYKHFAWSREVFESFARNIFVSASNQSGKSSTAIRKNIRLATEPKLWPKISKREKPTLFFYFYPSLKLARREIQHKWIAEFLPRNEFKDHTQYGWKLIDNADKLAILFNTGVEIQFLGYSQGKSDILQLAASSPSHITIDEECPPELFPEIVTRIRATRGMLLMVLTPVMCYPFYKEIFEGRTVLEDAFIKTVSMFSCLKYEDGTPGMYTIADIKNAKALLGSDAEIQRRIYGKYMSPEGLAYESFRRERNVKQPAEIPGDWLYYAGVDLGSGGIRNHPAAIVFMAVAPNLRLGRIIKCWRGEKNVETSNSDILNKYQEMKGEIIPKDKAITMASYDWAAKDFGITAQRSNLAELQKANKDRHLGVSLINTLFKNDMLSIDDTPENYQLVNELEALRHDAKKTTAEDDLTDAARYAVISIPWDFTHITDGALNRISDKPTPQAQLTGRAAEETHLITGEKDDEFEAWNTLYEDFG